MSPLLLPWIGSPHQHCLCPSCSSNAWSGSLDLLLPEPQFTSKTAGWVGFSMTCSTVIGGLVSGPIADRVPLFHRRLKLLICSILVLATASCVWISLALPFLGEFWVVQPAVPALPAGPRVVDTRLLQGTHRSSRPARPAASSAFLPWVCSWERSTPCSTSSASS